MPQADPYRVLHLSPGASLEEVRAAYRREAILCHPDSRPEDPAAALRRFAEIHQAYQAILHPLLPATTPEEYARLDVNWLLTPLQRSDGPAGAGPDAESMVKVEYAVCDEPAIFGLCWTLGLALCFTFVFCWSKCRPTPSPVGAAEFVLVLALAEAIVLTASLGTYAYLVRTRKIVWLACLLGLARPRRLPPPPRPTMPDDARKGPALEKRSTLNPRRVTGRSSCARCPSPAGGGLQGPRWG